ncbi:MAG TPA: hypothetical protein VKQ36_08940, partial [Ktedonobacterales bacterium]|nr:hypothetical protein [Ktedonobacterales bacterium]
RVREAAQLCAAAATWRATLAAPRMPVEEREQKRLLSILRKALGETAFEAAWQSGAVWSLDQAAEAVIACAAVG